MDFFWRKGNVNGWLGVCGLLSTLGGCGAPNGAPDAEAERVGQDEAAIINGTPVTADTRGSCRLTSSNGSCSGTLINNSWLLSARHCHSTETSFQVTCPAATGGPVQVTDLAHNLFTHSTADALLLHLPAPVNIFGGTRTVHNVVHNTEESRLLNKTVYCSGFGLTSESPGGGPGGALTSANLLVVAINSAAVQVQRNALGQLPYSGDSGGTCFLDGTQSLYPHPVMIGIVSGASDPPPSQIENYTKPTAFRTWLDQTLFTPPVSIGSGATSGPAIVATGPDTMVAFMRGSGNAIFSLNYDHGWGSTWTSLGGSATSDPAAAMYAPGKISVFTRGATKDIVYRDIGTTAAWTSLGGNAISDPAVVSPSTGKLVVVYLDADGTLKYRMRDAGVWGAWASKAASTFGAFAGEVSIVRRSDIVWTVFARTTSGSIVHTEWVPVQGAFGGWGNLGGNFKWGPAVTSSAYGRIDLFAVNQDGSIAYRKSWGGGWDTNFTNLGGTATYPVEATSRGTGSMDVVYRGSNNSIQYRQY